MWAGTPTQRQQAVMRWIEAHKATLRTPCLIYDDRTLNQAVEIYRSYYPKSLRLFFALKANPQPGLDQVSQL